MVAISGDHLYKYDFENNEAHRNVKCECKDTSYARSVYLEISKIICVLKNLYSRRRDTHMQFSMIYVCV